jgi:hypothetical protein
MLLSSEEEWQRVMQLTNISITDMGGFRNTLLNVYKEDLEDIEPWQDSNNYWDIGGGHHIFDVADGEFVLEVDGVADRGEGRARLGVELADGSACLGREGDVDGLAHVTM